MSFEGGPRHDEQPEVAAQSGTTIEDLQQMRDEIAQAEATTRAGIDSTLGNAEGNETPTTVTSLPEGAETVLASSEATAELREGVEVTQQVRAMLDRFASLAERNSIEGFDVFEHFLIHASAEVQDNFLDRRNSRNLRNTVQDSGRFPVNEFEFQQSIIEWGSLKEDTALEQEQTAANDLAVEENTTIAEENNSISLEESEVLEAQRNKNLQLFNSLLAANIHDEWLTRYFESIQQLWDLNDISWDRAEEVRRLYEEFDGYVTSGNFLEEVILMQAHESGNFDAVSTALLTYNEALRPRIDAFRLWLSFPGVSSLPPEQQIRTSTALGTDVAGVESDAEQSGNIFTLETDTGEEISYDVVSGDREISIDGYSLSSEVEDTGDYQTPKLEYMRVEQETLPNIQRISAAAEAIGNAMIETDDVHEIKDMLRSELGLSYYTQLGLEGLESASDIQESIQRAFRENTERLDDAREEYAETLDELRDAHMAALRRKDERVRETLRYFESIGFTQIPQYITDQVVDTLNSNSALRNSLGFSEQIDFENGELGMDHVAGDSEGIDVADRVAFAEFVNSMMGITDADGEPPINVALIRNGSGAPVGDRTRFQNLLMESGLLDVGGVQTALTNLEASRTGTEEQ